MKNSKQIISHLLQLPTFKPLRDYRELLEFETCFPSSWRNMIELRYVRNNIIHFALKHNAFKKEFDYNITMIKGMLKVFQTETFKLADVTDIKYFISYKRKKRADWALRAQKQKEQSEAGQFYYEHAQGDFKNLATDPDVHKAFEEIRQIILSHNQS